MRTFRTIKHPDTSCKKHPYEIQEDQGVFSSLVSNSAIFSNWKIVETCDTEKEAVDYILKLINKEKVKYLGLTDPSGDPIASEMDVQVYFVPK